MSQTTSKHIYNKISFPRYSTEFELQAEIFFRFKALDVPIRGEISSSSKADSDLTASVCKFDLVVFSPSSFEALAIIEVKRPEISRHKITSLPQTEQTRKYIRFGVPVYLCKSFSTVDDVVNIVMKRVLELNPNFNKFNASPVL